jgi:ferric-dicitrate binding protein FerR (iron transport regulator)
MDCEHAVALISAQVDHEIRPDDHAVLERHLGDCPECRATAEAFALQHSDLQRAFEPRRAAAAAVAEQVNAQLAGAARGAAPAKPARPSWLRHTAVRVSFVAGGVAAAVALLLTWLHRPQGPQGNPNYAQSLHELDVPPDRLTDRLIPRPRPADPAVAELKAGAALETRPGERRRVGLPDGSVLYVNESTRIRLDSSRAVKLERGEVFVEVAQRGPDDGFVVKTPSRDVKALGTKFEVRADDKETGVVVTQGKVQVTPSLPSPHRGEGWMGVLHAGQALTAQGVEPAPRASHLLDWTRDLMAAAESPLVPASAHEGGSLIAVDANGQEAKLSLRRFTVDVHIEDGFARTTIDQTYFNHHPWRLEGTFYFPLPSDASLSRLAMYVSNGAESNLMEGGMAERGHASRVYTQIVNNQRDPALLEWVDGTTFKMRVFPLEGRQEKRILLSYTQRLSGLYGRNQYRFPAGHSIKSVREWDFKAVVKGGASLAAASPTHPQLKVEKRGADLVLSDHASDARIDKDVAVDLAAAAGSDPMNRVTTNGARFVRAELDGNTYLALRYRPDLPGKTERQRRDWVFLYESSVDRDPLLARTQIDVIRHLLANAEHDDTFSVLAAGTRVHAFRSEPVPATPENVAAAVAFLERTHLIGALDLGRALREAEPILKAGKNPHLVHLGSGMTTIGTPEKDLAKLLPNGVRYVGIDVGKRWNRAWMKERAEKTGGYFTQINPDETISWRAFDLLATLNTPRLLDVQVTSKPLPQPPPLSGEGADPADSPSPLRGGGRGEGSCAFLTDAATLAQGEELLAVTLLAPGEAAPHDVTVTGTLDGQSFRAVLPVKDVADGAGYLPRTWAKWELERLQLDYSHTGRNETKDEIVALSKAMYVMTPFTSLLVLENDAMYEEFKVDRGRKDHWALYDTPKKIRTVYEPLPSEVDVRNAPQGLKPTRSQVRSTVLVRVPGRFINQNNRGPSGSTHSSREELVDRLVLLSEREGQAPEAASAMFGLGDAELGFDRRHEFFLRDERGRPFNAPLDDSKSMLLAGLSLQSPRRPLAGLRAERQLRERPEEIPESVRVLRLDPSIIGAGIEARDYYGYLGRAGAIEAGGKYRFDANGNFDPDALNPFPPALGLVVNGEARIHSGRMLSDLRAVAGYDIDGQGWRLDGAANPPLGFRFSHSGSGVNTDAGLTGSIVFSPDGKKLTSGGDLGVNVWYADRLLGERPAPRLTYEQLSFTADARLFNDLVAYAPGLNTSRADTLAVLDDEAAPDLRDTPGTIDPEARKLIDRARSHGWQALTLSAGEGKPGVVLTFDGAGRYTYERRVAFGLNERVVCDGKTLLHLYPEIGLAARRTMTRFHRAELTELVPWWLPPAADMARGCDLLVRVDEPRTVAIVPHGIKDTKPVDGKSVPYLENRLVFDDDGGLGERQLVLMPEEKVLVREKYDGKGGVDVFDADGRKVISHKRDLKKGNEPDLTPDTKGLVVLPLPYRSRAHTFPGADLNPSAHLTNDVNGCYAYLEGDIVLSLLATFLAEQRGDEARALLWTHFFSKGDLRPGLFTILAATGADLGGDSALQTLIERKPDSPLVRYFALGSNRTYAFLLQRGPVHFAGSVAPPDTFLGRLALARELTERWQAPRARWVGPLQRRSDAARTLAFVHNNRDSVLGWAMLVQMQQRGGHHPEDYRGMAKAWGELATGQQRKQGTADFRAQYEQACCLANGGKHPEARALSEELYARALEAGGLPVVDTRLTNALAGDAGADDRWTPLARRTAAGFIKDKRRAAVVYLAWQCQQLGDPTLADTLLVTALDGITDDTERLIVHLAAIDLLSHTGRTDRAGELMGGLLKNDKWNEAPELWRLAARLATQRNQGETAVECLERALDLEYRDLPEVINLESWRRDYGAVLAHYRDLAGRTTSTKSPLVDDFRDTLAARTIRAADRWRAHDPEAAGACRTASEVLQLLGEDELAWEYLTTPSAMQQERSSSVRGQAAALSREGRHTLAEFAYEVAAAAEPDDPDIVWERAQNLRRAGKRAEADRWLKTLLAPKDDETWNWRRARERAAWELQRK